MVVVLLTGEEGFDEAIGGMNIIGSRNDAECIRKIGALPVRAYDVRNAQQYAEVADILFLTDGEIIHSAWFGGIVEEEDEFDKISQTRDDLEFTLCQYFIENKKPIFGVGRGMQIINSILGGTLQRKNLKNLDFQQKHKVYAVGENELSKLCGEILEVNNSKEYEIKQLAQGLISAYQTEDKKIEAFYHEILPICGVMWNPSKKDWNGEAQTQLFENVFSYFEKKLGNFFERKKGLPVILVNGGAAYDRYFEAPSWVANRTYSSAISSSGGIPLMPLAGDCAEAYAEYADGLLLTGSISFVQREELRPILRREEFPKKFQFDEALFWSFYKRKKPILGICLGHQMINEYLGGTLESQFKRRTKKEHMMHQHKILVEKGTILEQLYGESFWVNSRHNDKIDKLSSELRVTAYSEDKVIEAFEHKELFIYGVEFHPERMRGEFKEPPNAPDMTLFFQWFCRLCGK